MSEPTNSDRAEWAHGALEAFQQAVGMEGETGETVATDLLCDLMHWCNQSGLDFESILARARWHYEAETVAAFDIPAESIINPQDLSER